MRLIIYLYWYFAVIRAFGFWRVDDRNFVEYCIREDRRVDRFRLQNRFFSRVLPQLVHLDYSPQDRLSFHRFLLQVKVVDLERRSDGPEIKRAPRDILEGLVDLRLNDYRYLVLSCHLVIGLVTSAAILQLVCHILEDVHVLGIKQNPVAFQELHQTCCVLYLWNKLIREYRHSVLRVCPYHLCQHVPAQTSSVWLIEPSLSQKSFQSQY